MRTVLAMSIVSGLLLCGCGAKQEPPAPEPQAADTEPEPAPPAEETKPAEPPEKAPAPEPAAAKKPSGYLETVVRQPKRIRTKFNDLALKQCLEAYKAMNGEYPKTLDDLKKEGMPPPPPPAGKKYEYDAKTGTVWLVDK